ncbi:beta-phosphoglucomutase [Neobacillus niacini]|uniref:beta-phosphoglucomutase n=1 Tax=Neobacillus niacini TaxID=86668 RepID=UPI0039835F12
MKRQLRGIIFDLDGVIVDTFELYYATNKKVADYLSIPFTRMDNEKFRGIGRMEIIEAMVSQSNQQFSQEQKEELAEGKNQHYQTLINNIDEKSILPGIKTFIMELKKNKIKMAIASSSTNAKTVLEKVGLINYFEYIVDPTSLKKGKPDPEIFLAAASGLNISPENCAAIEDGEAGLQAILAAKMFSIGIGTNKKMSKADWYVESTEELCFLELVRRFEG